MERSHRPSGLALTAVSIAIVIGLGACSSASTPNATADTRDADTPAGYSPPPCELQRPAAPKVDPVLGIDHDYTLTSFDGAEIRLHWYPLDRKAPTVLMGPGWGQAGATADSGSGLFGDSPIADIQDEGYHVLTWDPRGFGESSGTIMVDSADAEGRDMRRILDWLATQPKVQLDAETDPRVGMVGGSYGGGIQLITAAIDCRVDAIVPTIAWHSLSTSLNKADTVKIGWSTVLYSAAASRDLDPHITSSYEAGRTTGVISSQDREWFASRGPGDLVERIKIPTLFIQGTVDTLFTLDEAVTNYRILRANKVPTAMLWYCGGHGVCLTDAGDTKRPQQATNAWLRRWLQRERVDTGPRVEIIDQHGIRFSAPDLPLASDDQLRADGSGKLRLIDEGGSGPVLARPGGTNPIDSVASGITPGRADNAVNVTITAPTGGMTADAPELTLTYSGEGGRGDRPTRVFAQLIDDTTGFVIGNQVTPIKIELDGTEHTTSIPLEWISHTFAAGESVTLQLVATTVAYAPPRLGGAIDFTKVHIELPIASRLTRSG